MNSGLLLAWVALMAAGVVAVPTRNMDLWRDSIDLDVTKEVTLFLYTQGNPTEPELITLDDSTSPSFNPDHPSRLAIHGANVNAQKMLPFRDAYFATGEQYNIILVDWSGPAHEEEDIGKYLAILVADYIGEVLNHLINARGLNPDTLTIIGGSMGGHVAGMVGNRIGGVASEVVGLDPASDVFDDFPLKDQLDPSDGQFVQVLHTNAGNWGTARYIGHADFIINGGVHQLPCESVDPSFEELCSHSIADEYFAESIISNNFVATSCSNYDDYIHGLCSANVHTVMGEWTPHTATGLFYVDTNAEYPYAKGQTDL